MSNSVEVQRRERLLRVLERWLEWPLIALAFIWLILLVLELTSGLTPPLVRLGEVIWAVFIIEYVVRFFVAPHKVPFLKRSWLTLIALLLPALRVLRILRVTRVLRSLRVARIVTRLNRSMSALGRGMQHRGAGYVVALTATVAVTGAAGMYAFERSTNGDGLQSYGESLWWTAMLLTTVGSDYWPRSTEGRVLAFLLSLYALGILGYVAASLASFFVGRDAGTRDAGAVPQEMLQELRNEVRLIRQELLERNRSGRRSPQNPRAE